MACNKCHHCKKFPEENLSLTAEEGFGFYPGYPGATVKNGQYTIVRKLGFGHYSSTWLVLNAHAGPNEHKYRAMKMLTAAGTQDHDENTLHEQEILAALKTLGDSRMYLPLLRDTFEEEGPHGSHLCFVVDTLSTDVHSFRMTSPTKSIPVHTVKIIVNMMVEAIVQLHGLGIIHTDLDTRNVLFSSVTSDGAVQSMLAREGLGKIDGQVTIKGKQYPIVRSEPIPHGFKWNNPSSITEYMKVVLVDLGHAQWANRVPSADDISHYYLRAPEVLLRSTFDQKVDVWALGCLTFEMLAGHQLFEPEAGPGYTQEDDHLAKMAALTNQKFTPELLDRSGLRDKYFDASGHLRRPHPTPHLSVEQLLKKAGTMPPSEVGPAAAFISACLHLDPDDRISSEDLHLHDWLEHAWDY